MATKKKPDPSYCLYKPSGRAYVTLPDPVTGKRHVEYLGDHDAAESHAEYARVVKAWREHGRVVDSGPDSPAKLPATRSRDSVSVIMLAYWRSVQKRYCIKDGDKHIPSNASKIKQAVTRCRRYAGTAVAAELGACTVAHLC